MIPNIFDSSFLDWYIPGPIFCHYNVLTLKHKTGIPSFQDILDVDGICPLRAVKVLVNLFQGLALGLNPEYHNEDDLEHIPRAVDHVRLPANRLERYGKSHCDHQPIMKRVSYAMSDQVIQDMR